MMLIEYLKKIDYKKEFSKLVKILYEYREKVSIALLMIIFTIVLSVLTDNKNLNKYESLNIYDGTTFVTDTFPIFKDVVFVGDSYSHFLPLELGFDTIVYSSPGLAIKDLNYCFNSAMNRKKKYLVIFIGPNDYRENTDLGEFYNTLDDYVKMYINDSKVILCTYLPSMYTDELQSTGIAKYEVSDYDNEIKRVANSHDRVYYFDLTDFSGKSEYYKYLTNNLDTIHFNNKFYVEYINKLNSFILSIK